MKFLSILFILMMSCTSNDLLVVGVHYFKDLKVCESDICFTGTGTLPKKVNYKFEIEAPAEIDVLFLQTNHREIVLENPKSSKGLIKSHKKAEIEFRPNAIDSGELIYFSALNKKNGKHSWALLATKQGTANCEFLCNGKRIINTDVVCQTKVDSISRLLNAEEVSYFDTAGSCTIENSSITPTNNYLDFEAQKGLCSKVIKFPDGKFCIIYLYGYEEFPIREE